MSRLVDRVRLSDERGLSLIEMVMTLMILSIVLAFVFASFGSLFWTTEKAEIRLQNLDEARTIINGITKGIRTATRWDPVSSPFGTGNPSDATAPGLADTRELIFYANLDPAGPPAGPRRIRIYVDSSLRLMQAITRPTTACSAPFTCTYPGTPTLTRVLGYYVPSSGTIFRFYDDSTTPAPTQLTSTPLNAADLLKVGQIQITLTIKKPTGFNVPGTTVINQVRMPNVDYNPLT
jgi:prepilin-type N-terminal cleavage/methylation domain-containing protein